MLVIAPSDLCAVDTFPLLWRWTQESHALLTNEEIASIEPLRADKARELHEIMCSLTQKELLGDVQEFDSGAVSENEVITWLRHLPVIDDVVLVSWDEDKAVRVPWSLFVRRWDDFCYPTSDDVSIVPMSAKWLLEYWHYELFSWKQVNAT